MFGADFGNAFGIDEEGSSGTCRTGHGPPFVIEPTITASIAACG